MGTPSITCANIRERKTVNVKAHANVTCKREREHESRLPRFYIFQQMPARKCLTQILPRAVADVSRRISS